MLIYRAALSKKVLPGIEKGVYPEELGCFLEIWEVFLR
jgi:hypothetical protein